MLPFAKPNDWSRRSLSEKVQYYRDHLTAEYAPFVDKLEAKRLVQERMVDELSDGRLHLPRVLRVLDGPWDVRLDDLQHDRVIKAAHGSGWNLFHHPRQTVANAQRILHGWNRDYRAPDGGPVEPQYGFVPRRFFVEERLKRPFVNVKVRCIHGRAIPFITVTDESSRMKNFYDFAWNLLLPAEIPRDLPRPRRLDDVLRMAEKLAQPFEFVRVDFYVDVDDQIYFSEWTFTPSNGKAILDRQTEMQLGAGWN